LIGDWFGNLWESGERVGMSDLEDSLSGESISGESDKTYCYKCIVNKVSFKDSIYLIKDMKKSHYSDAVICVGCFDKERARLELVGNLRKDG